MGQLRTLQQESVILIILSMNLGMNMTYRHKSLSKCDLVIFHKIILWHNLNSLYEAIKLQSNTTLLYFLLPDTKLTWNLSLLAVAFTFVKCLLSRIFLICVCCCGVCMYFELAGDTAIRLTSVTNLLLAIFWLLRTFLSLLPVGLSLVFAIKMEFWDVSNQSEGFINAIKSIETLSLQ